MPSKKQRRRRAKSFRHEYEVVLLDGDGNEVELDPEERRVEQEAKERRRTSAKPAPGKTTATARGSRPTREPPAPTWRRAIRRGGFMGGAMLLAFIFLFKSAPIGLRLAWGVFYAAAFVPLTYFIDRTAYRAYHKRLARASTKKG